MCENAPPPPPSNRFARVVVLNIVYLKHMSCVSHSLPLDGCQALLNTTTTVTRRRLLLRPTVRIACIVLYGRLWHGNVNGTNYQPYGAMKTVWY